MKEIVIISGKGGTGKTSLTASFAMLAGGEAVVADCDVDAADMHLLLQPEHVRKEAFFSGQVASIDSSKCIQCGECAAVCRFDAISVQEELYVIDPIACEGCGYCPRVCPAHAITLNERKAGTWYISSTKAQNFLVHAALDIGAENSGKLVAKVKNEANRLAEAHQVAYVIVDGSPGIGCPVQSSLSGASFVVLVTEPTVSGLHDLQRVYALVKKFKIKAGCIINKANLNESMHEQILSFLMTENIAHIADIPFDRTFTDALIAGKTVVELPSSPVAQQVRIAWEIIKSLS
ncbi:MAG: ATP-binding protein [Microbacter sp.]